MKHHYLFNTTATLTLILILNFSFKSIAQMPYPNVIVQGVTWTDGTYTIKSKGEIISPQDSSQHVSISGKAKVMFISEKEIDLLPGFDSGNFTDSTGFFEAKIDSVQADTTIMLVTPDSSHVDSGIVHINKWEKFEIAFKLPQEYENAVDSFFAHYYNGRVDSMNDLNPYADDSLSVRIDITSPSGVHYTKWAFYMKEAQWVPNYAHSGYNTDSLVDVLGDDTTSVLSHYHWHFRFAPNEESTPGNLWCFNITVSSPKLPSFPLYTFNGLEFYCDPPLSDNHGYLNVNNNNKRYYVFDDGSAFFGIGENIPDERHADSLDFEGYFKLDYNNYINSFNDLHNSGGNYVRMWMYHWNFSVEQENLGVYDNYTTVSTCSDTTDGESGKKGNRQWYLWSFDQIMDTARAKDIYIQLTVELDYPSGGYQIYNWGNNCYNRAFVYPTAIAATDTHYAGKLLFLHPEYFYISNPAHPDAAGSAEYYWKRRYKYISSRWGYAVNLAAYESFNEVDQTIMDQEGADTLWAANGICTDNSAVYSPALKATHTDSVRTAIYNWHTDIGSYLKDTLADRHLFTVSYTEFGTYYYLWQGYHPQNTYERYVFDLDTNPKVDFIDIHNYHDEQGMFGQNRYGTGGLWVPRYWESNEFVHCDTCPSDSVSPAYYLGLGINKPFHFGEGSTFGTVTVNDTERSSEDWGNNYDLSFHNELWATALMGCNTTLLAFDWQLVHRWPNSGLQSLGQPLQLKIDSAGPKTIFDTVRTMFHNYKRLSEFMDSIDTRYINYIPHKYYNEVYDSIECYYLVQSDSSTAYGWVHNMNKYWKNAYYYEVDTGSLHLPVINENYYGCERSMQPPDSFHLSGFAANRTYYIHFYPTRLGVQTLPHDTSAISDGSGKLKIDLSTAPLGCDSTNADYAFVVDGTFVRRLMNPNRPPPPTASFDFMVYPNPSVGIFNVSIPTNGNIENASIDVLDMTGRVILKKVNITVNNLTLDLSDRSQGIYYIRLALNNMIKIKRIIVI